jgi:hypothetical protein
MLDANFSISTGTGFCHCKESLSIAKLYEVEDAIRGRLPGERQRAHLEYAAPRLNSLEHWLQAQLARI